MMVAELRIEEEMLGGSEVGLFVVSPMPVGCLILVGVGVKVGVSVGVGVGVGDGSDAVHTDQDVSWFHSVWVVSGYSQRAEPR